MQFDGISSRKIVHTKNNSHNLHQTPLIKKSKFKKSFKSFIYFGFFLIIFGLLIIFVTQMPILKLMGVFANGKHLILFQNSAELRPTGGFIGSFATVETKNYQIKNIYIDSNIYKRDNTFAKNNDIFPQDKVLASFVPDGKLTMRDSNWTADFSISASEIAWFYEHEGGSKVNNVVGITSNFFKQLLDIIGPINMVKYNVVVNKNNFNEVVQNKIENEYFKNEGSDAVDEPKSILSEMFPVVMVRVKNPKYWLRIYQLLFASFKNKDIILYSFNSHKEEMILKNNWGAAIAKNVNDYLYINNANLGGNKSSLYVNEDIHYNIKNVSGQLLAELNIAKTHTEQAYGFRNKDYTRIYVPRGSELIDIKIDDSSIKNDTEVSEEFDKTVFKFTNIIEPGKTKNINIVYKLPLNIKLNDYSLLVQKQPGSNSQKISITIENEVKFSGPLEEDLSI